MSDDTKLLPCPFCGSVKVDVSRNGHPTNPHYIHCDRCGVLNQGWSTEVKCRKHWNTRHPDLTRVTVVGEEVIARIRRLLNAVVGGNDIKEADGRGFNWFDEKDAVMALLPSATVKE